VGIDIFIPNQIINNKRLINTVVYIVSKNILRNFEVTETQTYMSLIETYQEQSLVIGELLSSFSAIKHTNEIKDYYLKIHHCFYKLKKRYPTYFSKLYFDENGHRPFSEDLDDIIQDFQVSGLINKLNPSFNTIIINEEKIKKYLNDNKQDIPIIPAQEFNSIVSQLTL
jgi:uncharacterized protein YwgA